MQVQFGALQRGLGLLHTGAGIKQGGAALVVLLLGNGAALQQTLGAAGFTFGQLQPAARLLQFGARRPGAGLVGARVDLEQQVTGFHQLAFLERHPVDVAAYPRAQRHGLRCFHPAGEGFPQGDRLGEDARHVHLRRFAGVLRFAARVAARQEHHGQQQGRQPPEQARVAGGLTVKNIHVVSLHM